MTILKIIALVLLALGVKCQPGLNVNKPSMVVNLQQGSISGATEDAGNGRSYYAFQSIPYAQPPVGDLRFRDPVRAKSWLGIRNGSLIAPECPQISFITSDIVGNEDCLYLNVYTPKPFLSGLPVMVYIHGGAFQFGHAKDISPLPLLTEDIVFVTFHYRLGTLGFLSTEDYILPGNLGLKDQNLALRWVQENIHNFGGNSNKVTVFGLSAGAVSTHLQVLTPYSAGLFQQAITHSGSALSPWALGKGHHQVAATAGKMLNCSETGSSSFDNLDSQALLKCLQNATIEDLVTLPQAFVKWANYPSVMIPRVDGDFLPDDPAVLLEKGRYNRVNLITGITAQDGDILTKYIYFDEEVRKSLVENFTEIGPLSLAFHEGDENPEYLARRAFHHYLGKIDVTESNADTLTQLFTDGLFSIAHDHTALMHARDDWGTRVYMYELHHLGQYSYFSHLTTNVSKNWVGHADDIQYLIDSVSGYDQLERPDDLMLRHIMVKLWTNFATTGNPTPNQSLGFRWLPVTTYGLRHLRLKPDAAMHNDERSQVREFWEALPTYQNSILFPERFSDYYFPGYNTGFQKHAGGPLDTSFTLSTVHHFPKARVTLP